MSVVVPLKRFAVSAYARVKIPRKQFDVRAVVSFGAFDDEQKALNWMRIVNCLHYHSTQTDINQCLIEGMYIPPHENRTSYVVRLERLTPKEFAGKTKYPLIDPTNFCDLWEEIIRSVLNQAGEALKGLETPRYQPDSG